MLTKHIALVNQSTDHKQGEVLRIAAALQKQVLCDFSPHWKTDAVVSAFESIADVPADYWKIIIGELPPTSHPGLHSEKDGQPLVLINPQEELSLACSRELLEMLVDPFGRNFISGPSLRPDQGQVKYLAEICAPVEAHSYLIDGVRVSDFCTPAFFSDSLAEGARCSFMGRAKSPFNVLRGGYISWMHSAKNEWWQLQVFHVSPQFLKLNLPAADGQCWRNHIDRYLHTLHLQSDIMKTGKAENRRKE